MACRCRSSVHVSDLEGIVEQVRSGSTLRIRLTSTHDNILLLLAGIRAPTFNYANDELSEPFSREAKFLTEHLLLHRDVTVTLQGIDKYNNFFGTVLDDQKRNISINLLDMGLAAFVDWSAASKADRTAFADAETRAKSKKLRLWKNFKQAGSAGADLSSSGGKSDVKTGKVVEIVNGSTIAVLGSDGQIRKLSLASVSVPRLLRADELEDKPGEEVSGKEKEKRASDRRNSAYAFDAKELLRSKLIGKSVKCIQDYVRPAYAAKESKNNLPPKAFWSVYLKGDKNVAIDLVREGLATVVPHGPNEARSSDFQSLIVAEKQAQKGKKGLHAPASKTPVRRVTDLSQQDAGKSAAFLASLKKGKVAAIVDYVFTGARLKCYVPSQELLLSFALQGIIAERVQRAEKPASKSVLDIYPPTAAIGNQALHYSRSQLMQRDVELAVESADKGGNFLGTLYVNGSPYGTELVAHGLAKVHERSAERAPNGSQLLAAQQRAKDNRTGLWVDYDPEVEAAAKAAALAARDEAMAAKEAASKMKITVTEIVDGGNLWYQVVGEQTEALESLMANFAEQEFGSVPYKAAKKGEIVAAKFSVDENWYRAEVLKISKDQDYTVIFVDYGNVEVVTADSLRPLASEFSTKVLPKQAHHGSLILSSFPLSLCPASPPPLPSPRKVDWP